MVLCFGYIVPDARISAILDPGRVLSGRPVTNRPEKCMVCTRILFINIRRWRARELRERKEVAYTQNSYFLVQSAETTTIVSLATPFTGLPKHV